MGALLELAADSPPVDLVLKMKESISTQDLLDGVSRSVSNGEFDVVLTACETCGKVIATETPITILSCDNGKHTTAS
jgi:hypothetical protein